MTYVKQILNREFLDTLDDHQVQQDGELPTENLFWNDEETKTSFFELLKSGGWCDERDDDYEEDVNIDIIKEIEREEDSDYEEDEDTSWCEVGEHYVNELDMWEDLADCKNCVSEKEMLELIEDYEDYEPKTKEEQEEEMWTQTIIDEEKEDEP